MQQSGCQRCFNSAQPSPAIAIAIAKSFCIHRLLTPHRHPDRVDGALSVAA